MRKIKIISNTRWSKYEGKVVNGFQMEFYVYDSTSIVGLVKGVLKSLRSDFVLINLGTKQVYVFSLVKWILPFVRFKLISLDILLFKPETFKAKIFTKIKALLFKKVDHFLLYFKDVSYYQKYFGIRTDQIKYIPFKVNLYERVVEQKTCDDGYILAIGAGNRDYQTFLKSVKDLKYKVIIVTPPNEISVVHNTYIDDSTVPENVTVIRHDGNPDSFLDYCSRAKFIVLPIKANVILSAGISTYPIAMALKKCLIMSISPGTTGILVDNKTAILVPPADEHALRKAIIKVYEDDDYRNKISEGGYEYAMSLKGVDRLVKDVMDFLIEKVDTSKI
jgi:glycosyltransferase involved in cell wall biosynthesis